METIKAALIERVETSHKIIYLVHRRISAGNERKKYRLVLFIFNYLDRNLSITWAAIWHKLIIQLMARYRSSPKQVTHVWNSSNVRNKDDQQRHYEHKECQYKGFIADEKDSAVAVSLCDGMVSWIFKWKSENRAPENVTATCNRIKFVIGFICGWRFFSCSYFWLHPRKIAQKCQNWLDYHHKRTVMGQ